MTKDNTRIILDFGPVDTKRIDGLKERMNFRTRTELVRRALSLMELVEEKKRKGHTLQFKKGEDVTEVAFWGTF